MLINNDGYGYRAAVDGTQPGDPHKGAQTIMKIVQGGDVLVSSAGILTQFCR